MLQSRTCSLLTTLFLAWSIAPASAQTEIRCPLDEVLGTISNRIPSEWTSLPTYTLLAGVLGLVVIAAMSILIPRLGVASTLIIIVLGQVLVGAVLDHYGWIGAPVQAFNPAKVAGLGIAFLGVWLTVR